MATVKTGVCPSCGKDRELAYFQFGIIKSTMCVHCLKRYLDSAVIPRLLKNNNTDDDKCLIGSVENE
ncbi:MAG: hypothetical protein NC408_09320 [Candidatus Gastranaerophilales bacterium]|nr:hypothetical protein [Candidatus Gastranaerophilales bacterium]